MTSWKEWSERHQPRRRSWRVGDRFRLNQPGATLVFEITSIRLDGDVQFWAPALKGPGEEPGNRTTRYTTFLREVRRRVFVRVEETP